MRLLSTLCIIAFAAMMQFFQPQPALAETTPTEQRQVEIVHWNTDAFSGTKSVYVLIEFGSVEWCTPCRQFHKDFVGKSGDRDSLPALFDGIVSVNVDGDSPEAVALKAAILKKGNVPAFFVIALDPGTKETANQLTRGEWTQLQTGHINSLAPILAKKGRVHADRLGYGGKDNFLAWAQETVKPDGVKKKEWPELKSLPLTPDGFRQATQIAKEIVIDGEKSERDKAKEYLAFASASDLSQSLPDFHIASFLLTEKTDPSYKLHAQWLINHRISFAQHGKRWLEKALRADPDLRWQVRQTYLVDESLSAEDRVEVLFALTSGAEEGQAFLEAQEYYRQAAQILEAEASSALVDRMNLYMCYGMYKFDKAVESYKTLAEEFPFAAYYHLAELYLNRGDFRSAIRYSDMASEHGEGVQRLRALGYQLRTLKRMGQFDKALALYDRLISLSEGIKDGAVGKERTDAYRKGKAELEQQMLLEAARAATAIQ